MTTVPHPRQPRCYNHHVWHASCAACAEQRAAERAEANRRLEQAAR